MKQIIPSIIAKDQKELDERISKVSGNDVLQLDVMDGNFVENNSLNFNLNLPEGHTYEAHLMMDDPSEWIQLNGKKVDMIIFHAETVADIEAMINIIKSLDKKVGIAIDLETPVEKIEEYLPEIDQVLVMTVIPGNYGGKFLPRTLKKVKYIWGVNSEVDIEVDGGINPETIGEASLAGANKFVVGSYLQNSSNVEEAIEELKKKY